MGVDVRGLGGRPFWAVVIARLRNAAAAVRDICVRNSVPKLPLELPVVARQGFGGARWGALGAGLTLPRLRGDFAASCSLEFVFTFAVFVS